MKNSLVSSAAEPLTQRPGMAARVRARSVAVGAAVLTAAAVSAVAPGVSAAGTGPRVWGTIHLSVVNSSIKGSKPGEVLISGAFADHGLVKDGTMTLSQGTITADIGKLNALLNSPKFATGYAQSCSFSGAGTATIPLIGGTGKYAGITGTLDVRVFFGAQSPFKNGKCDPNAAPVADQQIITGSGVASF